MSVPLFNDSVRAALRKIASETLSVLEAKSYTIPGNGSHDLRRGMDASEADTRYYSPDSSALSGWSSHAGGGTFSKYFTAPKAPAAAPTAVTSILQISTIDCARLLHNIHRNNNPDGHDKIGVLNFASATKPGGGFIGGARAQEESIARASTLYPTLLTNDAQEFYQLHKADERDGFYTHAIVYSPGVVVFRDDSGGWTEPLEVDVLTCAAVNAGEVRRSPRGRSSGAEDKIEREMTERMGRLLYLFEKEGVKDIVLGSFGTGVFRNNVSVIARMWADLLAVPGARFGSSFERVMFAIIDERTLAEFETAFNARTSGGRGGAAPLRADL
ncbi:hypothetical protein BOTBODRAFT_135022 [Botryobasidium botryosum FD-172 SS1]|uniref:Microbial-type PARG catalytic domain-containing protein n=1 Tax=Botryobasidium botryosum (strain FD-172 SS1) TaxID=930990 RepID=A0A067M8M5_BOTB1|nr:hypothetical protein BOTBODRAFT_135022 [Botryobasidium botryosum FD-172 SS1]